jgi:plasmid stabilization system protein ParE
VRLEYDEEARDEYEAAIRYYRRISPSVATRFISAIESATARVIEAPLAWPRVEKDVRRCLARPFPYSLLYSVEPDVILVVAIMHNSREPGYWADRLTRG